MVVGNLAAGARGRLDQRFLEPHRVSVILIVVEMAAELAIAELGIKPQGRPVIAAHLKPQ